MGANQGGRTSRQAGLEMRFALLAKIDSSAWADQRELDDFRGSIWPGVSQAGPRRAGTVPTELPSADSGTEWVEPVPF
jgi:hypothetical protein